MKRHFSQIPIEKVVKFEYRESLFGSLLSVLSRKRFCPNCRFCEDCEINLAQEEEFFSDVKAYIQSLFLSK